MFTTSILDDARAIVEQAIASVLPEEAVTRALEKHAPTGRVAVVAIGKAAYRMAIASHAWLSKRGARLLSGLIVTKTDHAGAPIPGFEIVEASHPVPDENAIRGADIALANVSDLTAEDTVLFLVSGGGSALFEKPMPGVSLSDIQDITRALLRCGADIVEINTVRKRLSAVKGGRFAEACAPARVLAIVLSDVLFDSLDAIASGPAYPDATTCADAAAILDKYAITPPAHLQGALAIETPKALDRVETEITGNVSTLCETAVNAARALGYAPLLLSSVVSCEARDAGRMLSAIAWEIRHSGNPVKAPCAVIFGGETVVHVTGHGLGGRNQELALAAAEGLSGLAEACVASIGSDGTDGPTDAAGGVVTGESAQKAREVGVSLTRALADNDAYHALDKIGGLIKTGPTGTNVNDLTILLVR